MKIRLLRDTNVPTASWHTHCECCGPVREYPDIFSWEPKETVLDPDELYSEINLIAHKDTFKFGEDYEIIEFP